MKVSYRLPILNESGISFHGGIVVSQSVHRHTYVKLQLSKPGLINLFKPYFYWWCLCCFSLLILTSCSVSKQISKQANQILLKDSVINTGHIGISIYEPATNKYWYNYDAEKYFVPASNVKLFTLYAGLKYLGDSLIGLKYKLENKELHIYPTGDPTFLHPDFKQQIVFDFLKNKSSIFYHSQNNIIALGKGWAWDDYMDYYMVQRSEMPIYGNLIQLNIEGNNISTIPKNLPVKIVDTLLNKDNIISRNWNSNELTVNKAVPLPELKNYQIPLFVESAEVVNFLADTLQQKINLIKQNAADPLKSNDNNLVKIFSQPVDSLFKPMLYNSDNFFAEQTLLMASNAYLGNMNEAALIDTLLKKDFKEIPQKPRWVDGSGLSRYNLFSPQSVVYILNKLQKEYGINRLKTILPTGGEGTLKNYYQKDSGYIFAKTGSMSNHTAISGYLYSQKGKLLIFSILVNQFQGSTAHVRHAVETFLEGIRAKY